MRFGTFRPALCMGLLALFCQASLADGARSAASEPESTVKNACKTAKGATKKECEKVAAKMDAQANDPAAQPADEAHADADYVHHSSPAVRSPEEVQQDKATAKQERKNQGTKPEPK